MMCLAIAVGKWVKEECMSGCRSTLKRIEVRVAVREF